MKIVKENSRDMYKSLKKVNMSDSEWLKVRKTGKYITDGFGNIYEVPSEGYSDEYEYGGKVFRYNYSRKRMEWVVDGEVVDSTGLSPSEFLDDPAYWFEEYYDELEYER